MPVVTLLGPRQAGKTTLAKATFANHKYVSLEQLDERAFALGDPRGFVLTGSQNLLLMQSVSQSLAGRTAILRLLPLALSCLGTAERQKPRAINASRMASILFAFMNRQLS